MDVKNIRAHRCFSYKKNRCHRGHSSKGFTLIESIVGIVIIAIAMITLLSFIYPQIRDSARPYYEVRASALANSLMTEILARGYDHNSDPDGGIVRCGENSVTCTTVMGPEGTLEIEDEVRYPGNFNDVDDYTGCWFTNEHSKTYCPDPSDTAGSLTDILGENISDEYPNFAADIALTYATIDGVSQFKRVTVTIQAGQYGSYDFIAYRGNY